MRFRILSIAVAASTVLLVAPAAHAIPGYPGEVVDTLALPPIDVTTNYPPPGIPCSLCHVEGNVGRGSARTPFATNMRARGLNSDDHSTVSSALIKMYEDRVDSDGDGKVDVDEFRDNTDPNSPLDEPLVGRNEVEHGCNKDVPNASNAHFAPKVDGGIVGLFAVAGLLAIARRRR